VTVRASGSQPVDVTLTAAPPPPKVEAPPPVPVPAKPAIVRTTERPRMTNVTNFIDDNFIGRSEPRKDSNFACMGTATATLVQLRDPMTETSHDNADEMIYIVAGEATIKINGHDQALESGAFATVPMGTPYSMTRRGRNPVIMLSIVSGEPCKSADQQVTGR
jgi:mannose-6-phosphate isomerase-like protein (cupin superfamily)